MRRIIAGLLAVLLCVSLWGCEKPAPTEPKCDHQFGDWLVKSKATCSKEGREERLCSLCYATESRAIAMTEHTYKSGSNVCKTCYYVNMDPDGDVVELGILTERGFGPSTLANCAWDVKIWNGQVFRGAGDYGDNAGETPIFAFDIATGRWQNYGMLPDMAIHGFAVVDGMLCAPGVDPSGSWKWGNYYYLKDGKWKSKQTIPNGIHCFDMAEFDGKIFVGTGTEDFDNTVAMSKDGGETFEYLPLYQDGDLFDTSSCSMSRCYELTEYNGDLYALICFRVNIGSNYKVFRYEKDKMVLVNDQAHSLIGGSSYSRKYWTGEFEFDGACYLTLGELYAIRDFSDLEAMEKIQMPNKEKVVDAFLRDGVIYTLAFSQNKQTREYNIVIYKSTTGKTGSFTPVASFTYDVPPLSFDYDGNHFYVGMGYDSAKKEKIGMVLRVKPAAE